jgi:hypothetical protein
MLPTSPNVAKSHNAFEIGRMCPCKMGASADGCAMGVWQNMGEAISQRRAVGLLSRLS